jgi:hypothetical protein
VDEYSFCKMDSVRGLDLHSPQKCQPRWFICSAGWNLGQRTQRLRTSTRNTKYMKSLYWFGPLESKTLRLVLDYINVDDLGRLDLGFGLARLILTDGQGRWTQSLGQLQQGNQSKKNYNIIPWSSDYLEAQPTSFVLSRTPTRPDRIRLSRESSRRSSGGRVGHRPGRLGPLSGRRVFWWAEPTCQGRPWAWLVWTLGYPCLTSPWTMCRRSNLRRSWRSLEAIEWSNNMHVGPKRKRNKSA